MLRISWMELPGWWNFTRGHGPWNAHFQSPDLGFHWDGGEGHLQTTSFPDSPSEFLGPRNLYFKHCRLFRSRWFVDHSLRSSDARIKVSKEMFTKTFLCFFLGRTSPAALSLKSTAQWCSEIFGRGLGLMIRITRYWYLCKLRGVREWSGVRKPQDKQQCLLFLCCVFLSFFSL